MSGWTLSEMTLLIGDARSPGGQHKLIQRRVRLLQGSEDGQNAGAGVHDGVGAEIGRSRLTVGAADVAKGVYIGIIGHAPATVSVTFRS